MVTITGHHEFFLISPHLKTPPKYPMTRDYFIIKVYCLVCEHYQHRLIRKVLSHTICVFINLQLGRSPLHLDDLVTV
jgi:hypothetical protein